jgi:hypothetical protein
MSDTLLLASFHDPEARLLPFVSRLTSPADALADAWRRVRANYAAAVAVYSPATDERSLRAIVGAGWELVTGITAPDRGLRAMVELGLERPIERMHFCDLDRLAHWLDRYPGELASLPCVWEEHDLTMLVRSPRAYASHPLCQTLTEGIANAVLANRLQLRDVDAYSGSYVWSRRAAEAVLNAPGPRDLRFYTEGVLAPFRAGCSIGSLVVEGLEWETPDQYAAEIGELGYAGWLARFESAEQWRHRAEMARVFVEAALTP